MSKKSSEEIERDRMAALAKQTYVRQEPVVDEHGNKTGEMRKVVGLHTHDPSRVIDRVRRCQNCHHWDQEEAFSRRVKDHIYANATALDAEKCPPEEKEKILQRIIGPLTSGIAGLCKAVDRRTEPEIAEFTHALYACNTWSGDIKVEGGETTPDEVAAIVKDQQ